MIITRKKATQEQTKQHNKRLILKTIYTEVKISRVAIARRTKLTRTTVSTGVSELMAEGLVEEVGQGPSAGGKRPTLLSLVNDARHLIGLDLGNSRFVGAVANLRGEIERRESISLEGQSGEAALTLASQLIDKLLAATNRPILGIGIGTPGVIDTAQGLVKRAVNLNWENLPLGDLLTKRHNLPVYVANDSHVAALAEYTFGQHQNTLNLIVLKVGRGIGAGIVLNGQLFHGDGFGAGEIGHVVVINGGQRCTCGNFGCLETIASSRAVIKQAQTVALSDPTSILSQFASHPADINIDKLLNLLNEDDAALNAIINNAGLQLGVAVANLVGALNVRHIIIAGSLARFEAVLLDPLKQCLNQRALTALVKQTTVETSTLGTDIVTLGAAAMLLTYELGLV